MCVGAIVQARVAELIVGAREPKTGACGSAFDLLSDPAHCHHVPVRFGVMAQASSQLLRDFFARTRLAKQSNTLDTQPPYHPCVDHD
jgi:tRNA(adenine34) deaminase